MKTSRFRVNIVALGVATSVGCAQETTFFHKPEKSDKQEASTEVPLGADANQKSDTKDPDTKIPHPSESAHAEGDGDLGELESSAGGLDIASLFQTLLGGGGGDLDISSLGSLQDLIGLFGSGLGGLGNIGDILAALGGSGHSIKDLIAKLSGMGGKEAIGPKGIFKEVSKTPADDTSAREDTFCKAAASVKQIAGAGPDAPPANGLSSLLGEICDGETAKSALVTKLIGQAYTGSNDLAFHTLRALASDDGAQTSSVRYAFAIKLPGSAKEHFDQAATAQLTVEGLESFLASSGGTATASIVESYENDGEFHVRGILASQKIEKTVFSVAVSVESETRYDHHALEADKYYLYTSAVAKAVSGIESTDTIGLAIQDGDSAYLISLVDIVAPNRGFAPFVEAELETIAIKTTEAISAASGN